MAMSGKIKDGKGKFYGEIAEIDYNTGETLNVFSVNYGYYRSYEFDFDAEEMAKSVNCDNDYFLGRIYKTKACEPIDTNCAKEVPEPILESCYENEKQRAKQLEELAKKNPEADLDPEQDMARIQFRMEDDVLYVTLPDHFLEVIYFVGKAHTYVRDFTETKQERPEYFARGLTIDSISLSDFEADKYEIYFKHNIGLYKTGHAVEVSASIR